MGGADENTSSLECSVVHGILEEEQRMLLKFMGGGTLLIKGRSIWNLWWKLNLTRPEE